MEKKYSLLIFLLIFIQISSFAQLNNFTFSVSASPATCVGNGVLNFTTSQTHPDATLNFSIYLLPNTATPVATTPATSLTGLNPGNYLVIAKQTLGALNNSQQQNATIGNQISTLNYNLTGTKINCLAGGTITANVTAGNPVSYQIINGPMTTEIQTSNTFSDLIVGTYDIRVIDLCGQGIVKSYTITETTTNPNAIVVSEVEFWGEWSAIELIDCNTIRVGHRLTIVPDSNIPSPLTFTFTIFPPDGSAPIITTSTANLPSSASGLYPINIEPPLGFYIPYFDDDYFYNLTVTDPCGNSYYHNNTLVNKKFGFNAGQMASNCGKKVEIIPLYFTLPITIEFLSAPAGFIPEQFNNTHPVASTLPIIYDSPEGGLPGGTYVIKATDNCGRESIKTFQVSNGMMPFFAQLVSCELVATVFIPTRQIIAAHFISVPSNSPVSLPYNLENFIGSGSLVLTDILTPGSYIVSITDNCGQSYVVPFIIIPVTNILPVVDYANGCDQNSGSVNIHHVQSVELLSGPASYQPGFPDDVSYNIYENYFLMNSLPSGIYTARAVNMCGFARTLTLFIGGYFQTTEIEVFPNCSSFDFFLDHVHNNADSNDFYWLQKQDPITGSWGHPTFGGSYIEGSIPDEFNSIVVNNQQLNTNIGENGHYRILTISKIFPNGNFQGQGIDCIHLIKEFDVENATTINGILNFACSATVADVFVDVSGIGPFNFTVLEKNGVPFLIENQQDPLFTNLEIGIYKIQIEDYCGNYTVFIHDVSEPVVISVAPFLCEGQNSTLSVPDFPYLQYEWFKQGAENIILSNTSTLSLINLDFNTDSGIYYVNIIYPANDDSCLNQMLSYEITPEMSVSAGEDSQDFICDLPLSIDLNTYLNGNFSTNGIWQQLNQGGNLIVNIWTLQNAPNGIYQFKYIVNGLCGFTDEAMITLEILDQIPVLEIEVPATICAGSDINISIVNGGNPNFNYTWTGPNNFTSNEQNPIITNATIAMSGMYNLTVTAGNCIAFSSVEITVNSLPDFNVVNENVVICEGQSSVIEVVPTSVINIAYEYIWYYNNVEIPGETLPIIEVNEAGIYSVEISSGDCSITKVINVTENPDGFKIAVTSRCENNYYKIRVLAIDGSFDESTATYNWSGPNNFTATTQSVDITNLQTGTYTVIVTAQNGCSVMASTDVNSTNCQIPKGISPNGDGKNDTWDLSGFDIDQVKIFNRYGLEVFDQNNYEDEWHGQSFNGKLLPTATYYYLIRFSSGEEITGWVYLNREIK